MRKRNRNIWIALSVGAVLLLVLGSYLGFESFQRKQTEHTEQRQSIANNKVETVEQYFDICIKRDESIANISKCFSQSIDANRNAQRAQYDLQAQQEMSEWAYALFLLTLASLLLSAFGLIFLFWSLRQTRDAVNLATEANRIAAIEREPLIAIVSAKISSARVDQKGAILEVDTTCENAGGSAAYGFKVTISGSPSNVDGFEAFTKECCDNIGPSKYVILKDQEGMFSNEIRVPRKTQDDWVKAMLDPLKEKVDSAERAHTEGLERAKREGREIYTVPDFNIHQHQNNLSGAIIMHKDWGMTFHVYIVATWIGLDSKTKGAGREYLIVGVNAEGQESSGYLDMYTEGRKTLGLRPIGAQILWPYPNKNKGEQAD